jgi:transposase
VRTVDAHRGGSVEGISRGRLEGGQHPPGWAARRIWPHAERRAGKEDSATDSERTPDQLKLAYALWTRQAASELIEAVYGVRLTVRNMGKYPKRWGFTPQRPLKKAYEQSPEAVAKWVNEEYPKIPAEAKQEGGEIQWGDDTGLRSDDVRGRGYAPKGKTPVVLANANRSKLSASSTVTNKGQMR